MLNNTLLVARQEFHVFALLFKLFEGMISAGEKLWEAVSGPFLPQWALDILIDADVDPPPGISSWLEFDIIYVLGAGLVFFLLVSLLHYLISFFVG